METTAGLNVAPAPYPLPADLVEHLQAIDRAANALFEGTGLMVPDWDPLDAIPVEALEQSGQAGLLWLGYVDGMLAGFAASHPIPPDLYLDQISVDPSYHRRGLGRALVQAVQVAASARFEGRVSLSTFRDLPWNGPFYRKLGFVELPRRAWSAWQRALEIRQEPWMDIRARCFMVWIDQRQRPTSAMAATAPTPAEHLPEVVSVDRP